MSLPTDAGVWGRDDTHLTLVARNVSTRYAAIAIEGVIGLLLLPFNVAHLGPAAYGLWMLTASVTVYFSVLDLGYGGALVKFVAQYRAWRDRQALNEVLSTMGIVFTAVGLVTFGVTSLLAWQFDRLFQIDPGQAGIARQVLLIIGGFIALRFSLSIFGAVVYGFQRYYLNNVVGIGTSIAVALVNVAVLSAGHGLVELVAATTLVRVLALGLFAWNAFRVYPGLYVSPALFRRARLREVTGFSLYILILDWSAKLNYSTDSLVIGAMIGTTAVAVWTVAQRLAEVSQQLTNQLNDALFPIVVDSDAVQRPDRLRLILLQGTRLSIALAMPVCVGLIFLADGVVRAWVGPSFSDSVLLTQILLVVVLVRVGTATANQILKGAGRHKLLAVTNSTAAVANVLLSITLVRHFGLPGVAIGTLLPIVISAGFVLFPAACRRVGVPLTAALARGVWPATWPVVGMVVVLAAGRAWEPTSIWALGAQLVAAGLVYQALFFGLAIGADERRYYWTKLRELAARRPRVPAAA
jgi:O-antigen/teichoic acid export membrane protein